MKTFTYKSKYSQYEDCYFRVGHYENNNIALEVWNNTDGPITRITVNPDRVIPHTHIAIKDYSENEGVAEWLIEEGYIVDTPTYIIPSGWINIPVYALTEKGLSIIKESM